MNATGTSKSSLLQNLSHLKVRLPFPVLLYLLVITLPIGFNLGPLHMSGVRLLLIVMIIPLSVNLLLGKYGRIFLTDVLFFLHFLWIIVALAVNNPDQVVQNAGSTGIEFLGGYVLGRAYIRTRESFMALLRTLVVIVLCCFPLALYEALTGTAVLFNVLGKIPGISSLIDLSIEKRLGLERVQVSFSHPIHWGLYCSMAVSFCFIGLQNLYSVTTRLVMSVIICFSGLLALSSGAILAILLQAALIVWAGVFRNINKRWWILLGLFAVAYVVIDLLSNRTPIKVFMTYATFSAHSAYWRALIFEWGMVNVWGNPMFGLGLKDWIRPAWMHTPSVDNFWLLITMRFGIPAFLFLAVGYAVVLLRVGLRRFDDDRVLWNLRRAWMFSFMGLTFTLTTVHIWGSVYSFVFFVFGAGMWMMTAQPEHQGTRTQDDDAAPGGPNQGRSFTRAQNGPQNHRAAVDQIKAPAPSEGARAYTRFPVKKR
jgi:hypothetical protein